MRSPVAFGNRVVSAGILLVAVAVLALVTAATLAAPAQGFASVIA